jgi:hypothetical protein
MAWEKGNLMPMFDVTSKSHTNKMQVAAGEKPQFSEPTLGLLA